MVFKGYSNESIQGLPEVNTLWYSIFYRYSAKYFKVFQNPKYYSKVFQSIPKYSKALEKVFEHLEKTEK